MNDFFTSLSPKTIILSQSQPMALGSDKLREWHVMQSCPVRHERSAGQGLGLLAPKEETQEKRSFSPIGTTVSDCGAWTSCSYPASSLQMGQRWRETGR